MSQPLLSIIIPMYNGATTIERCLDSVVACPIDRQIEIIVLDDGSTDGSDQIVEKYRRVHSERSIALHTFSNGGQSVARNRGIDLAKGKYIWFVDCDDTINPEFLGHLISIISQSDCCHQMILFETENAVERANGEIELVGKYYDLTTLPQEHLSGRELLLLTDSYLRVVCSMIWQREYLSQHAARFEPNIFFEDTLFFWQYVPQMPSVYVIREVGYHYIYREGSTMNSTEKLHRRAISWLKLAELLLERLEPIARHDDDIRRLVSQEASMIYHRGLYALACTDTWQAFSQCIAKTKQSKWYPRLMVGSGLRTWIALRVVHLCPKVYYRRVSRAISSPSHG